MWRLKTLQDESLRANWFYAHKLHLIEEGNAKLAVSIYNSISLNASNFKTISCYTGFNLKQEDFPILPFNVPLHNSVCNPDKPIVKYVHKSISKFVSTSSVLLGKPITDGNVLSSKLVSASPLVQVNPFMVEMFA